MSGAEKFFTWCAIVLALWTVFNVWWFASNTEWRKRGLYLWRVRKFSSFLGLPVIGRHNGYVGMTGNRTLRDRQHLFGTQYEPPAPWSDLNPRAYPLPCWFPGWEFARKVQEKWWIFVLLPVYNVQWNTANPRRIHRKYAYALKARRQAGGRRVNLGWLILRAPVTLAVYLVAWKVGAGLL